MRSADYVEMTTTSIAGSGAGAVTCTALTNVPTFTTVFGSQATTVRYIIEDTVNKKFEKGIGSVAANVLTRTSPQITWDGTTWSANAPSALAFNAAPTSGDIRIRMGATTEAQSPVTAGANRTIAGDANWRDYALSAHIGNLQSGGTGIALVADREYYSYYRVERGGVLTGAQFEVTTAVASSNLKWALYSIGSNGLPTAKIVDFVTTATATTGIKTDTATASWSPAGAVYLPPGEYAVGFISSHATSLRFTGALTGGLQSCFGRKDFYGNGDLVFVAGSYTTGLPASPSLGSGTLQSMGVQGRAWLGLKVTP